MGSGYPVASNQLAFRLDISLVSRDRILIVQNPVKQSFFLHSPRNYRASLMTAGRAPT